jgi:hypothetical protein
MTQTKVRTKNILSMKTIYLSLLLAVLCGCGNTSTQEQSSTKITPTEEATSDAIKPEEQAVDTASSKTQIASDTTGQVVYITHDGNKYHTADCRYAKSAQAVKLSQAKADGKTACDICKPNAKTGAKQIRCSAKTKEGKQCQRMTTDGSGKCFQHKN